MRSALGDAAADDVRRAHDRLLAAAVEEHAGRVVKSLGDGILASFSGAADAIAAAVTIQQKTEAANRRVEDNRRLQVRIGCSAGDVAWEDDDCHGTPVVVASRLCDRATGGQILCDDLVRGLARGRSGASFRIIGELELKGLHEPVVAYDVPWSPVAAGAAPLPAPLLPVPDELPFAGRDEQRKLLLDQWKSAQGDGRTVALVSGEPGVGKTRLTAELARIAHDEGAWVLAGRCDESIAAPYTPWLEILRHAIAHAPPDLLDAHVERHGGELTRLVPELARRIDDVPALRELDPDTERLALFDAVVDLVDALAADAPAFVVVDDAHWADAASLDLLRWAVRHLPTTARVLFVVTYRDTDVDRAHPLSAVIGDLRREPRVERLALRGMDEDGIRDLLTAAGGTELDDEGRTFAHTLAVETEGNPFFIREILRHLIESGVLVHRDGRWQGTVRAGELGIPEGIRDVVGRRLTMLSDESNETLRAAAVVGREFDVALVADVMGTGIEAALASVEEALRARLVDEVPDRPGRMSFSHALVRSTLLEELSTTRRVRLHGRIGEVLEARPGTPAAELAHHFAEAAATGMADRAVHYAALAAEEARRRVAYDEALRFYDVAFETLGAADEDPRQRAELLCGRAYVHALRDDPDRGHADALEAAKIARSLGDAALLARAGVAYTGLFSHWAAPSNPVGIELLREGLAGLGADDAATRAHALSTLASALIVAPGDEALELAPEAERLAAECGDPEAQLQAFTAWAWALRGRGRAEELCEVASTGLALAERERQVNFEMALGYLFAAGLIARHRIDEAMTRLEHVNVLPTPIRGWFVPVFRATLASCAGRFDEAFELTEQAHQLGGALGDTNDAILCGQRSVWAHRQGRLDDAHEWVQRSMTTGFPYFWLETQLLAEEGRLDEARAASETYERDIAPLLPTVIFEHSLDPRATIAWALRDTALAEHVEAQLQPYRAELLGADTSCQGSVEHALGLVALTLGRVDEAVDLIGRGLQVVEGHGFHAIAARDRVDLAEALLVRGGAGDADRAAGLLDEALEAAAALGLGGVTTRARALR
jgi:tetratricopeptide (TPR) repeat protein